MGTVRTLTTPTAGVRLADAAKVFLHAADGLRGTTSTSEPVVDLTVFREPRSTAEGEMIARMSGTMTAGRRFPLSCGWLPR